MQAPDPRIVPLLEGSSLGSGHGSFAFCSVVGVQAVARDGQPRRVVVDTEHVGTRRRLLAALEEAGLAPTSCLAERAGGNRGAATRRMATR
jgi:hypothetical protein